eukprot:Ihof_evm3s70 gene=Ihof_evmTU3s70
MPASRANISGDSDKGDVPTSDGAEQAFTPTLMESDTVERSPKPINTAPKRRSGQHRKFWSVQEDEYLRVKISQNACFAEVSAQLGRTEAECRYRWQTVLDPNRVKGYWTREEDDKIVELVGVHGEYQWPLISSYLPGRVGKQCRSRWHNHLKPGIRKGPWTVEEDEVIIKAQVEWGNKWAMIARLLPGRTDNAVKNYWNSSLRKRHELIKGKSPTQRILPVNTAPTTPARSISQYIRCPGDTPAAYPSPESSQGSASLDSFAPTIGLAQSPASAPPSTSGPNDQSVHSTSSTPTRLPSKLDLLCLVSTSTSTSDAVRRFNEEYGLDHTAYSDQSQHATMNSDVKNEVDTKTSCRRRKRSAAQLVIAPKPPKRVCVPRGAPEIIKAELERKLPMMT